MAGIGLLGLVGGVSECRGHVLRWPHLFGVLLHENAHVASQCDSEP